ncbi:MAG: hypothetical protein LUC32_08945 [Clostridiales bacterium]|nr:hypothetical protein [Clostridiales bacterium]
MWYTAADGSIDTMIDANLDDEKSNASAASTYYTLSYKAYDGSTEKVGTTMAYASKDSAVTTYDAPTIASTDADGVYILHVWNEDAASLTTEAGYTSGSSTTETSGDVTYYMYVDRHAPKVDEDNTTTTEPASGSTGNDVTLYYVLNDGTGSGLDTSTVKLYYSSDVSSLGTEIETGVTIGSADSNGNITISYTISKDATNTNGYYTLTFADCAGNADSTVLSVTKMDKTAMSSAQVYYSSASSTTTSLPQLTSGSTTTIDASTYSNVYLYLTGAKADKAVFTYTGTLTSPSGKTYTYEHKADSTAMALWISDTTAVDLANEEGQWKLETKTETDQNVAEAEKTTTAIYYIIIDSTKPTITNTSGTELSTTVYPDGNLTTPTNEDVALAFKVSDAKGTIDVSGIKSVEVRTDSGDYIASAKDTTGSSSLTLTEGSDGSYTFYVQQNGTYTIKVTDNANNVATYEFTVSNIDKTNPDKFGTNDIAVKGVDGSSASGSAAYNEQWYRQNTSSTTTQTWVEVSVPASDGGSILYTYVAVWPYTEGGDNTYTAYDTTQNIGSSYYVTQFISGDDAETKTVTLPADGKWNVAVWRQDEAGNITASSYVTTTGDPVETMSTSLVVYTDITMPEVDVTSSKISIAETGQTMLAKIANFLTFGNFFNEGFEITLSGISDAMSEVKTVYYVLTDSNAIAATVADGTATITGSGTATLSGSNYVITLDKDAKLDGYIWIYVEDNAGNMTTPVALKAYNNSADGVGTWMIDTVDPTITFSYSSANGGANTDGTASTGWYNLATGYPTVKATAEDGAGSTTSGVSGIAEILRTIATKETEADASYTNQATDTKVFPGSGSVTEISASEENSFAVSASDYGDGIYQLTYTATDNALRTVTKESNELKVDMTRPTLTLTAGTGGDQKTSSADNSEAETKGTLDGYFTLTTNTEGVGTNWLNTDQLVTLAMSDATSGFSNVTITTNGGLLKDSTGANKTIDGITSSNADESFYVCANGTYTITVTDVAGNTTTYELTVTNVDTTNPTKAPEVTIKAADGSNAATGTSWLSSGTVYNIDTTSTDDGGATVTITAPEAATGEAPQTTYYILWNTSDTADNQATQKATVKPITTDTTFTITEDGIWELIVYTEDEAENRTYAENHSESAGQKIYVDIDSPSVSFTATSTPKPDGGAFTSADVTVKFSIDEKNGSGIDPTSLKLTFNGGTDYTSKIESYMSGASAIISGAGTADISFVIEKNADDTNGTWTLSYTDLAGNVHTLDYVVDQMDASSASDLPLPVPSMNNDAETYENTDTDETYYSKINGDLTLSFEKDEYTGKSAVTTTITITSPSGKTTVYTITNDGTDASACTVSVNGGAATSYDLYTDGFSGFNEDGKWTVKVYSVNGAGTDADTTYTYYVDTTKPKVDDVSGNPTEWTNETQTITLTISDPFGNTAISAEEYVSGIANVSVSEYGFGATLGTSSWNADTGKFTFEAESNGVYRVTAVDNVGNTLEYDVTVIYIDKTNPAAATVEVTGTAGTALADGSSGWWKIEADNDNQNIITITANEQAENYTSDGYDTPAATDDEAKTTTYFALWEDEDDPGTSDVSSATPLNSSNLDSTVTLSTYIDGQIYKAVLSTDGTITIDLAEGKWNLRVWTVDEAGNSTENFNLEENGTTQTDVTTLVIYDDETEPVIDYDTLTIKKKNNGFLAKIGNLLTFGNFFNQQVVITVSVTDESTNGTTTNISKPETLYYYVTAENEKPDITNSIVKNAFTAVTIGADGTASISTDADEIDQLLNGYIWVYAVDVAGNESDVVGLVASEVTGDITGGGSSTYFMIDTLDPTISLTLTDSNEASRTGTWFTVDDETSGTYPVVWANIREGFAEDANVSGINIATRTVLVYDPKNADADEDGYVEYIVAVTLYEATAQEYTDESEYVSDHYSMTDLPDGDHDGMYKVVYYVADNAGNEYTKEIEVNVDTTAANASVDDTCEWYTNDDEDTVEKDPQKVVLNTDDSEDNNPGASGVAYVVVTPVTTQDEDGNDVIGSVGTEADGSDATTESITLYPDDDGNVSFYVCENGEYNYVVYDNAGNASEAESIEVTNMDTVPPTIDGVSPDYDETGVDYNDTTVTLTFSEEVVLVTEDDGKTNITVKVNGETYVYVQPLDENDDPEELPLTPVYDETDPDTIIGYQAELDLGNFVLVDEGGDIVTDVDGDTTSLTNATETTTPVYVQDTNPDGSLKYDEDGDPVYKQATDVNGNPLTDENGDPVYEQATDEEGNLLYEEASFLDANTEYTLTIPAGAFTDLAGNETEDETTVTFTTKEADEDDPWMVPKYLSDLGLAAWITDEDEESAPNYDYLTVSGNYDAETSQKFGVTISSDIVDMVDGTLEEDLAVLVLADEVESYNVTVEVTDLLDNVLEDVGISIEEYTELVYNEETGEYEEVVYTAFVIAANGEDDEYKGLNDLDLTYFYIRVTTENYGITNTYSYLISLNGIQESTHYQSNTEDETDSETTVTVVDGTMIASMHHTLREIMYSDSFGGNALTLQFISSVPKESAIATQATAIRNALDSRWQNHELYFYEFDMNLINGNDVQKVTSVDLDENGDPLSYVVVNVTIPESILGESAYAVYYYHEGTVKLLGCTDDGTGMVTLSADGKSLTLNTYEYSVYAVTGPEIVEEVEEPEEPTTTVVTKYVNTTTTVTETKTVPSTKTSVVYRSTTASAASDEDEETLIAEAEGSGDTVDAKTDAKTEDEESEDAEGEDGEVSASGLKQGLALADLLFVVLSLMVAEYSTLRQKKKKRAVNDLLCIGALVLFFVTQPLKGLIGMTDKYTPFFLAILAVQVVVLVLKLKKQDAQTEEVK